MREMRVTTMRKKASVEKGEAAGGDEKRVGIEFPLPLAFSPHFFQQTSLKGALNRIKNYYVTYMKVR